MKRRWPWLAAPLGAGVALGLAYSSLGAGVTSGVLTAQTAVAFVLATVASGLAARDFGKGDYLRVAWGLFAVCYGLLLLDTVAFGASDVAVPRHLSQAQAATSGVVTLIANLATVVSLAWVSRAWRVAGLDLQVSRGRFWGALLGSLGLACLALGADLVHDARALADGDTDALHLLASELGDITSTGLLVPMLFTALSLRGGSLAWPWGLLTASTVCWLGVDGVDLLGAALHTAPAAMMPVEEGLRLAACLLQVTAALAQREALRGIN